MPRAERKSGSLAYGILRVTLTVGAITVLAALLVTFIQSYRLAASQVDERIGAYLEVMKSEASARLASGASTVDHVVGMLEALAPGRNVDRVLISQYAASRNTFEGFMVVTPQGTVEAAYPRLESRLPTATFSFLGNLRGDRTEMRYLRAIPGERATLWAVRPIRLTSGQRRFVVGRFRTDFLDAVIRRVSSRADRRSALVLDGGTILVTSAQGPMIRTSTAEYGDLSGEDSGRASAVAPSVGSMRGLWGAVGARYGLDWRVLVLEPAGATIASSLGASIPTLLVLILGVTLALAIAWVVSRRLVEPLREIEAAGLEAAKGAYVPPLTAGRDDEVGRLADAFNAVALRLNALHDVSRMLAGASRLDDILDAVVGSVGHLLGSGLVAIYLTDVSEQSLRLVRSSGGFEPPPGPLLRSRSGPFLEALRSERVLTPQLEELPMQDWDIEPPSRTLVAPLVAGNEQLGVIVVFQHGRGEYSEAETEMMHTFAAQAAIGITKSRLFEREIESRRIAESLRDIAEELVRPVSFAETIGSVSEVVSRALDGRRVMFAFEDRESLGLPQSEDAELERLLLDAAAETRETTEGSSTLTAGAVEQVDDLLQKFDATQVVIASIEPTEPFRGVFAAFSDGVGFEAWDTELVEGMVKIVTLAFDNAYFFERSRVRAKNLETIFRISQAVGSSLQLKVVLNRVLDVVQMIFAADAVSLMTYDQAKRTVTTAMARGAISTGILHLEVEPGEDLPGRVFDSRQPVMLRHAGSSYEPLAQEAAGLGLNSLLSVPLLARGSAVGVLTVFSADPSAFDDEDMGLLQTFASQAALALDTARLYSKEHEVAATLQRSILPEKVPEFEEIETATAYSAASSEAEIGGDYYDLFRTPGGQVAIAVADVCGKGVGPPRRRLW